MYLHSISSSACVQHEHQKREAERLACDKQKAAVMKLIGKLAKPTRTVIDDTSISLTIDRNKKLHSEVLHLSILYSACHLVLHVKWARVNLLLACMVLCGTEP